jgi:hypothetical protein
MNSTNIKLSTFGHKRKNNIYESELSHIGFKLQFYNSTLNLLYRKNTMFGIYLPSLSVTTMCCLRRPRNEKYKESSIRFGKTKELLNLKNMLMCNIFVKKIWILRFHVLSYCRCQRCTNKELVNSENTSHNHSMLPTTCPWEQCE